MGEVCAVSSASTICNGPNQDTMSSSSQQTFLAPFDPALPLVALTTDGACSPNPGPGAWAYVLRFGTAYKEQAGCCVLTTNNRMELRAVIEGLKALTRPCRVVVRTDSKNTIAWCGPRAFQREKKRNRFPEAYAMALEFRKLAAIHTVSFLWVPGHAGDIDNERCDLLASEAIRSLVAEQKIPAPALSSVPWQRSA